MNYPFFLMECLIQAKAKLTRAITAKIIDFQPPVAASNLIDVKMQIRPVEIQIISSARSELFFFINIYFRAHFFDFAVIQMGIRLKSESLNYHIYGGYFNKPVGINEIFLSIPVK